MKAIKLILFIILCSCSLSDNRSPANSLEVVRVFETPKSYIFSIDIVLAPENPKFELELPNLEVIDFDQSISKTALKKDNNVACELSETSFLNCNLIGDSSGNLVVNLKLKKYQSFPIYESRWKTDTVKRLFSYDEVILSKINKKLSSKEKLFLTEKQFLLNTMGSESEVTLDVSRRESLKLDLAYGDMVSIESFNSDLYLEEWGAFSASGLPRYELSKKFKTQKAHPYAFYCESKTRTYNLNYSNILISDGEGRAQCLMNLKRPALFKKNPVKGNISFNLKVFKLSESKDDIDKTIDIAEERLKDYLDNLNNRNYFKIYNLLKESYEEFSKNSPRKYAFF